MPFSSMTQDWCGFRKVILFSQLILQFPANLNFYFDLKKERKVLIDFVKILFVLSVSKFYHNRLTNNTFFEQFIL